MDEDEDTFPPFWLQSDGGRRRRHLRRSYSLMISSGAFLMFITVITCVIIFIVLPTLKSFTSQIFRPQSVKKSWDSLNLILVLFAIVCGFLSRNNNNSNETPRSYEDRTFSDPALKSHPEAETPTRRWYEYSESSDRSSISRLRSFNSYPDLRQESLWVPGDERWRFHDDTSVNGYRGSEFDDRRKIQHRRVRSEVIEEEEYEHDDVRNISVDTFVVRRENEVPSAPPVPEIPPPSPPPQVGPIEGVWGNAKRIYHAAGRSDNVELDAGKWRPAAAAWPPPRVGPTEGARRNAERTYHADAGSDNVELDAGKYRPPAASPSPRQVGPTEGVRRNAKRTYHADAGSGDVELDAGKSPPPPSAAVQTAAPARGVWKNSRRTYRSSRPVSMIQKEENGELEVRNLNLRPPPPSIPPPPPPPPLPLFYLSSEKKKRGNATKEFLTSLRGKKKKQRQKSIENFETILNPQSSHPPPPPPPPPPPSVFYNLFSPKKPKHKKVHSVPLLSTQVTKTQNPSISKEGEIFNFMEGNVLTGNESPFNPIPPPPPPPPPPPFGIPAWRFRVQGDFVRVNSGRSSRSNSPDIDEESVESPTNQEQENQQPRTPPLFCPSPDVDTKADTFIARFRAGLKLEKMNSMKGKSNLGPS